VNRSAGCRAAGRLRETMFMPRASTTRIWSEPHPQRVHTVWPAAVPCRDTTWKGSARSGQPQYGHASPSGLPWAVLVICLQLLVRVVGWTVATPPACIGTFVYVQVDFLDLTLKRGLHD
jgi:hypothetical protein